MSASRTRGRRPPTPARARRSRTWLLPLLIVVAGAATYWNSLSGPFIWDDQISIVNNRTIQQLWPLSGPLSPPPETPVARRPLVNLTFAVNYAAGGLNETGYHLANIALHIGCALVLFGIVRRTSTTYDSRRRLGGFGTTDGLWGAANTTALVVALIWMLHPLQSEPVNYLTQRSESLMALFFLLTLYCAIRARGASESAQPGRHAGSNHKSEGKWQVLSVAACACGMACKESMVVAPVIVVLYDWAFEFESIGAAIGARKRLYAGLAATWAILAAFVAIVPRSTVGLSTTIGPWTYLVNQADMIARYLRLSAWPSALVLDYGLPRAISLRDALPSALVVVALLAATGFALLRSRPIGFLAASFFLTLAPTSSVIPISSEVGSERRMYLPFAALAALVVVAGRALLDRAHARRDRLLSEPIERGEQALSARPSTRRAQSRSEPGRATATSGRAIVGTETGDTVKWNAGYRATAAALTGLVVLGLAIRTIARNAEYRNPLTLWRTVVDRRPHGRARMALATELMTAGRPFDAIAQLREAVDDFPDARAALGTELLLQHQLDEGIGVLRQFIGDDPSRPNRIPAHVLIAQALTSQNKLDAAAGEWRAILAMAPADAGARANLAQILVVQAQDALKRGDAERADRYAREAVQLAPGDRTAHNLLGVALATRGRMDEAIVRFRKVLELAPDDQQARANLEKALRALRNRD